MTSAAHRGGDQATEERERGESRRALRFGTLAWTAVVAAVALASSATALVFEIWPGLRPDPRTNLGATVSVFSVERGVTPAGLLQTTSFSPDEQARKEKAYVAAHCQPKVTRACAHGALSAPGELIFARTSVEGFKWRSIGIRASLYYASTQKRDPQVTDYNVAGEALDAPSDSALIPVWLPCPETSARKYFARVELYDSGDDVLLAVGDSKTFAPIGCP